MNLLYVISLFLIGVFRLVLFFGILVTSSGSGLILYKVYENKLDINFIFQATPYLLGAISYFIFVFYIDKILLEKLNKIKNELSNW